MDCLKHLTVVPIYVGVHRNLFRTQDPKGFIPALPSKNELRPLHFLKVHTQVSPLPSNLVNQGGASCYMAGKVGSCWGLGSTPSTCDFPFSCLCLGFEEGRQSPIHPVVDFTGLDTVVLLEPFNSINA